MCFFAIILAVSGTAWAQEPTSTVNLVGQVLNYDDDSPIPKGSVVLHQRGVVFNLKIRDGQFSGPVADGDGYGLRVLAPGFEDFRIDNVSVFSGMDPLVIKLRPARLLRGRVVDGDGNGIAQARVSLALDEAGEDIPMSALTDSEGLFQMAFAMDPGVYFLVVMSPGFENKMLPLEHPVDREVLIQLDPSPAPAPKPEGSVEGVLTRSGGPLPDREIWLTPAEGGAAISVRTDSRGRFRFAAVPVGRYWLEYLRDDPTVSRFSRQARVEAEVKAGESSWVHFATFDGRLRGVVVAPDGTPLGNIPLRLSAGDTGAPPIDGSAKEVQAWRKRAASQHFYKRTDSDGDGYFDFSGLQPGSYLLSAGSWPDTGYQEVRMSVEVPEDDRLRIELTPALRLRGVLLDFNGEVVPAFGYQIALGDASGSGLSGSVDSAQGLFVIDGLKPARYSFKVNLADGRQADCAIDLNLGTNILFQMPAIEGMALSLRYEK